MKYVLILASVVAVYFFLIRGSSVTPIVSAVAQPEAAPLTTGPRGGDPSVTTTTSAASNYIKRPIDRTKEVLSQVKQRNGDGEF